MTPTVWMTEAGRTEPPATGDERALLAGFLDYQRDTMLWKISGLTEAQLRRTWPPSRMSLLGMVKHLALVERWWFQAIFADLDVPFPWSADDPDADFRPEAAETAASIVELYQAECARSREIVAAAALDEVARNPKRRHDLRWIMIHMIEETARHNGHADLFREQLDGTTGE